MKKLFVFPFNGNGLEAISCIDNQYELIGFIDDTKEKQGKTEIGIDVFDRNILNKYQEAKLLIVPGSPVTYKNRAKIIADFNLSAERFATVIHPNTSISKMAQIGYNVLIMPGVVLTSNCVIGNHVIILPNTVIHHDTFIDDYSLIGSNVAVAGNVHIAENCYIATGTNIINGISIGKQSLIGLGTNVTMNIPEFSKVVGNPARHI